VILDNDPEFRSQVRMSLEHDIDGVQIIEYGSSEEAWNRITAGGVTLAIASANSMELRAIDLLHRIKLHRISTALMAISDPIDANEVVDLIKNGAHDFLERPFAPDQLVSSAKEIIEKIRKERIELVETEFEMERQLIGNAPPIEAIRDLVSQVAPTNSTVLITGESGTGKEILARTVHKMSKRKDQSFVIVDCGTIPAGLVESELFGYVSGAFTGATRDKRGLLEQGHKGTVFLDEVGEFPLDLQVKLLRVLQDGEIRKVGSDKVTKLDLRVVAATNKELEREVRLGRFRQDLFYRLNVVHIEMPPLRVRSGDIEMFVNYFLKKYQDEYGHSIQGITKGVLAMLISYEWPGNVRELEHTMLQIMALHNRKTIIEERDLPMFLEKRGHERQRRFLEDALDLKLSLDDYAREFIRMFESEYSEKEMASALGITTKTLWQKRRKWGMPRKKKS
jgi:DNA-binding NtrC family response regulator